MSYFQFDSLQEQKRKTIEQIEDRGETKKHLQFALDVRETVDSILKSNKVPRELSSCHIEIVDVIVNHNLTSTTILWQLPEDVETSYTEEETSSILDRHLTLIRSLYPCFTYRNTKPVLRFLHVDEF